MFITKKKLKEENEKLKVYYSSEKESYAKLRSKYNSLMEQIKKSDADYEDELRKRDSEIEKLKRELDILYKHFSLDSEPTQEVKTAVRIDKKVYELENENIRLNAELNNMKWYSLYVNNMATMMQYGFQQNYSPVQYFSNKYFP